MASMMDAATAVKKGAPFCHVYDFDATSACLLWSTIAKAPCYTLQMRVVTEGGGFPQWKTLSASVKGQRVRKNKLDADTAYEFRVAAMVENATTKSTFTLGTQQDKDALKAGAYSAPALLQKRSAPALAAPVVFDADGDSATVTWSGGSPPFSAIAGGEAARPFMPRVFGEFLADKGGAKRRRASPSRARSSPSLGASWDSGSEFEPRLARDYAALKAAGKPASRVLVDNAAADVATNFDAWVA
ncbi:C2 domain-containing protein [Aureococcus anophagefferens]|nr:C2 domain-containing protein [Aureococcus anophagefferens]